MMSTTEQKSAAIRRGPPNLPTLRLVYSGDAVLLPPIALAPSRGATPIGRDATAGIALPNDPRAARHHATLHAGLMGTLHVVDEGSRNGTFVNGRRVTEVLLADGDLLAIGDSYFIVRCEPDEVTDASVPSLLGTSAAIGALRHAIQRVARTDAAVLVLAEAGCGKEVVARALHDLARPDGPFLVVRCGAVDEAQLFGPEAVGGGAVARPGLLRAARGGTLFLDEVGELPLAGQRRLLRVLEETSAYPIGFPSALAGDVRVIAATSADLGAAVAEQRFRGDLHARLARHPLTIAPLRDRKEDVLLLLLHALGAARRRLAPALVEALLLHPFPLNMRELNALASQLRIGGGGGEVLDLALVADHLVAPLRD